MHRFILSVILIAVISTGLYAQVRELSVNPGKIDPSIREIHGSDVALYDTAAHSRQQLIFMIQGTGASAADYLPVDRVFAKMGYHVIGVDYMNNVISTVCLHSKDSACADDFRKEIITGDPVSDLVKVDSVNCLLNRFKTFLQYLTENDPEGGWRKYIAKDKPVWKNIIVAGHSQGAGHAAYLGKMFTVKRVLIFSGPQDYLADLNMPAPWLSMKSATPPDRYDAFLNLRDPFNVHYQILNCEKLMDLNNPDTMRVSPGSLVQGNHHILVNDIVTKFPHLSTMFPRFRNAWAYMLGVRYGRKE